MRLEQPQETRHKWTVILLSIDSEFTLLKAKQLYWTLKATSDIIRPPVDVIS